MWGGRHHLPHIHNKLDFEPYIHFPWENNSCALDSIMTAWWVLFNTMKKLMNHDITEIFEREYPEFNELFIEMFEGQLDNIQAKEKVRRIFQGVLNSNYQSGLFIELPTINNHIDEELYDQNNHTLRHPSLLYWRITVNQKCVNTACGLHDTIVGAKLSHVGEFELLPTPSKVTFHIQDAFMESVTCAYANQTCDECKVCVHSTIETNSLPHVIKIRFPTINKNNRTKYKITRIDKFLMLENTKYNIVGAIYGDDEHFMFRYVFDDMIYEADGMHMHQLQVPGEIRHSAESIYITNDYDKGMPVKIKNTQLVPVEIYYIREYTTFT